jgi:chromosome segregation ATPase
MTTEYRSKELLFH